MSHRCRIEGCDRSFVNSTECSRHEKTHFEQVNKLTYQDYIVQLSNDYFLSFLHYCFHLPVLILDVIEIY